MRIRKNLLAALLAGLLAMGAVACEAGGGEGGGGESPAPAATPAPTGS